MNRRTLLIVLLGFPAAARAHSYSLSDIGIGHAWAHPAAYGDGQLFIPMANNSQERDELVAARSSVCTLIELRRNNRYDDPPLASFALEPKRPLPMRPRARHLRLMGLNRPLELGQRFPVVLDFLKAGEIEIEAQVENSPGD